MSISNLFGDKKNRRISLVLLVISCILLAAASIIGISDNPPGVLLLYLGTIGLILVFLHSWRQVKKYLYLILVSVIGIPVFGVLHNFLEVFGERASDGSLWYYIPAGLGVASFLVALIICPAGLAIGIVGAVVFSIRNRGKDQA